MKILIACEESQAVCKSFRKLGYEAFSCDIEPCSGGHPEWHIQGDVLKVLKVRYWNAIIAFPPCTYISNAGACRLYPTSGNMDMERYAKGIEGKRFFMEIYNHPAKYIAIENPISSLIFEMPKHTQEIQPYYFGDPYRKKTRLWLKNLPELIKTNEVAPIGSHVPSSTYRKTRESRGYAKRGEDSKNRSKTFQGIANAMAEQWGGVLCQ